MKIISLLPCQRTSDRYLKQVADTPLTDRHGRLQAKYLQGQVVPRLQCQEVMHIWQELQRPIICTDKQNQPLHIAISTHRILQGLRTAAEKRCQIAPAAFLSASAAILLPGVPYAMRCIQALGDRELTAVTHPKALSALQIAPHDVDIRRRLPSIATLTLEEKKCLCERLNADLPYLLAQGYMPPLQQTCLQNLAYSIFSQGFHQKKAVSGQDNCFVVRTFGNINHTVEILTGEFALMGLFDHECFELPLDPLLDATADNLPTLQPRSNCLGGYAAIFYRAFKKLFCSHQKLNARAFGPLVSYLTRTWTCGQADLRTNICQALVSSIPAMSQEATPTAMLLKEVCRQCESMLKSHHPGCSTNERLALVWNTCFTLLPLLPTKDLCTLWHSLTDPCHQADERLENVSQALASPHQGLFWTLSQLIRMEIIDFAAASAVLVITGGSAVTSGCAKHSFRYGNTQQRLGYIVTEDAEKPAMQINCKEYRANEQRRDNYAILLPWDLLWAWQQLSPHLLKPHPLLAQLLQQCCPALTPLAWPQATLSHKIVLAMPQRLAYGVQRHSYAKKALKAANLAIEQRHYSRALRPVRNAWQQLYTLKTCKLRIRGRIKHCLSGVLHRLLPVTNPTIQGLKKSRKALLDPQLKALMAKSMWSEYMLRWLKRALDLKYTATASVLQQLFGAQVVLNSSRAIVCAHSLATAKRYSSTLSAGLQALLKKILPQLMAWLNPAEPRQRHALIVLLEWMGKGAIPGVLTKQTAARLLQASAAAIKAHEDTQWSQAAKGLEQLYLQGALLPLLISPSYSAFYVNVASELWQQQDGQSYTWQWLELLRYFPLSAQAWGELWQFFAQHMTVQALEKVHDLWLLQQPLLASGKELDLAAATRCCLLALAAVHSERCLRYIENQEQIKALLVSPAVTPTLCASTCGHLIEILLRHPKMMKEAVVLQLYQLTQQDATTSLELRLRMLAKALEHQNWLLMITTLSARYNAADNSSCADYAAILKELVKHQSLWPAHTEVASIAIFDAISQLHFDKVAVSTDDLPKVYSWLTHPSLEISSAPLSLLTKRTLGTRDHLAMQWLSHMLYRANAAKDRDAVEKYLQMLTTHPHPLDSAEVASIAVDALIYLYVECDAKELLQLYLKKFIALCPPEQPAFPKKILAGTSRSPLALGMWDSYHSFALYLMLIEQLSQATYTLIEQRKAALALLRGLFYQVANNSKYSPYHPVLTKALCQILLSPLAHCKELEAIHCDNIDRDIKFQTVRNSLMLNPDNSLRYLLFRYRGKADVNHVITSKAQILFDLVQSLCQSSHTRSLYIALEIAVNYQTNAYQTADPQILDLYTYLIDKCAQHLQKYPEFDADTVTCPTLLMALIYQWKEELSYHKKLFKIYPHSLLSGLPISTAIDLLQRIAHLVLAYLEIVIVRWNRAESTDEDYTTLLQLIEIMCYHDHAILNYHNDEQTQLYYLQHKQRLIPLLIFYLQYNKETQKYVIDFTNTCTREWSSTTNRQLRIEVLSKWLLSASSLNHTTAITIFNALKTDENIKACYAASPSEYQTVKEKISKLITDYPKNKQRDISTHR